MVYPPIIRILYLGQKKQRNESFNNRYLDLINGCRQKISPAQKFNLYSSLTKITAGDLNKEVDDQEDKALFAKILRCVPNPRAVVDISYDFLGGRLRFIKKRHRPSACYRQQGRNGKRGRVFKWLIKSIPLA